MRAIAIGALVAGGCFFEPPRPLDSDARGSNAGSDAGPPVDLGVNYVFATSMPVMPATLGGLAQADAACATAAAGTLPGTYVAWLSTSTVDAIHRLDGARGWQRPDYRPVADLPSQLVSRMMFPPRLDELGHPIPAGAFAITGTNSAGARLPTETCTDYSTATGQYEAGFPDGGGSEWTASTTIACNTPAHLYCFGIDRNGAAPMQPRRHPIGFVSVDPHSIGTTSTVSELDAFCQNAADAKMLGGSYRALVATNGMSARSRFAGTQGPWYRIDGIPFTTNLTELDAPLAVTETGFEVDFDVFFGAPDLTSVPLLNCADWTRPTDATTVGSSARTVGAFSGRPSTCDALDTHLYCLEYTP